MSTGWSLFVAVLAAFNILGCVWLLWWTSRRRPGDPKPEETSHYWDGDITEYNKPMPRWWINGFYIAIAFGVGYLFWYGGLGTFDGIGRWSSQGEHAQCRDRERRGDQQQLRQLPECLDPGRAAPVEPRCAIAIEAHPPPHRRR